MIVWFVLKLFLVCLVDFINLIYFWCFFVIYDMKYIFICKNKMIDLLKRLFVYKNYEYIYFESIYLYMLCIIYYEWYELVDIIYIIKDYY